MKQEIKTIPKDWQIVLFKDIVKEMKDGGTPSRSKKEYFDGNIPWVVVKDIKKNITDTKECITEEGLKRSSARLWPINSVILSFGATIGEVGIAKNPLTTKQGIAGIITNEKMTTADFIYYFLLSKKKLLNRLANGSTIKEIRPEVIKKQIKLLLPPLDEQRKITEILSKVDDDIKKTEEIIEKTEKLKKGLMGELFTKGIGHKKFKKSELGEIPEEWNITTIKNSGIKLIDGDRGVNYPKLKDFLKEGYCLFLNNKNIKHDRFVFNECNFITKEKDECMRKGKLEKNDIVLTSRGTVGNVAYYDPSVLCDHVRINSGMLIFRHGENYDPLFLYKLMSGPFMKKRYKEMGSGSAQPQLPVGSLDLIQIPLLPIKEQRQIAKIILSVDEKIEINKQIKNKLIQLKKGLMNDLLSGDVRV